MIAPDTNVLVRIITNDHPSQAAVAAESLRGNTVLLSKTVILELEWVLRYSYGFGRAAVSKALMTLVGLKSSVVEDAAAVECALSWHAQSMDLADALHLASSLAAEVFVTFDRRLADAASGQGDSPQVHLLTDTSSTT